MAVYFGGKQDVHIENCPLRLWIMSYTTKHKNSHLLLNKCCFISKFFFKSLTGDIKDTYNL